MCIKFQDKTWWKEFCKAVKRAFKKNDFEQKVFLCDCYLKHMRRRHLEEFLHYKHLDFDDLVADGKVDPKTSFFDWIQEDIKKTLAET